MPFLQRLQSAMILKTPMYQPYESALIEHPQREIYRAISENDNETIIKLIEGGYDVDYIDATHTTALILAITLSKAKIVQTLLCYGANADLGDAKSCFPLHQAILLHELEITYLLLRYNANANRVDRTGLTAYELAERSSNKELQQIVKKTKSIVSLNDGIFSNTKRGDLIALAAQLTPLNIHQVNAANETLLHQAVCSHNVKLVIYLLNKHLDVDAIDKYGNTPLINAVRCNVSTKMIQLLIDRHATIDHANNTHTTALSLAFHNAQYETALLLIHNGANLFFYEGVETALSLCHKIIPYDDRFRKIQTILYAKGVHVDIPTNRLRWTPLIHTATKVQDEHTYEHLELLIQLGANINYQDKNGRTPLMLSGSMGRLRAVELLLENSADINKRDRFGWTALMLCVYYNHPNCVKLLLDSGCDAKFTSKQGLNAYIIAKQNKRTHILKLFEEYNILSADDSQEQQ